MNEIDKARKRLELSKVKTAKQEMEFKILMRLEDIERIKSDINIQDARIQELEQELEQELQGE